MRNAAGEFDDLQPALDVAPGVWNGLAVLARQQVGELVIIALHQFEEFHHYAGAPLRIRRPPLRLRRLRVLDRGTQLSF